jgi:hypothetical protein
VLGLALACPLSLGRPGDSDGLPGRSFRPGHAAGPADPARVWLGLVVLGADLSLSAASPSKVGWSGLADATCARSRGRDGPPTPPRGRSVVPGRLTGSTPRARAGFSRVDVHLQGDQHELLTTST